MKLLLLILRNLRRNLLRTTLTALGTMVLVVVVTMVWSFLAFFDRRDGGEEPELQGHRHRALADSQPDAVFLRRHAGRWGGAQRRRRAADRLDDLAVLRRHARSEEHDARKPGVRHRHGAEQRSAR